MYIGQDLQVAFQSYKVIDDISSSFNGSTTSFALLVNGSAPVPLPINSQQCLISVAGVIQRPDDTGTEGFRLSGGNIVFSSAPATGADFFGVILAGADYINAGGTFPDGSAAVPSITFNDDPDTGIYRSGANQISVSTGGTERSRFTSNGELQSVNLGTASAPAYGFVNDPNTGIYSPGADSIAITTGGSQRATVDSSGRLLIGTSSARDNFFGAAPGVAPRLQLEGADTSTSTLSITRNSNDADGPTVLLGRSRGAGNTVVQSGDRIGRIQFQGNDATSFVPAAVIESFVDGTPGTNDMPGRLVFSTTADGASSPTERMRIHGNGYITYGTGSVDSTGLTFGPTRSGANSAPTLTWNGSFTGTVTACDFLYNGARQGSITTTTSATAYNTSSDYRLKENIEPLTGASGRLNQLQVHRFNFISDPGRTVDGFIAHEAQAVVPECVTGTQDEVDEDGNPVYQGIDQSKLVPLLTAALQEAIAEIASLKDRVAALEAQ